MTEAPAPSRLLALEAAVAALLAGFVSAWFAGRSWLAVGAAADVCVFDPAGWWKVDRAALRSLGKNTPFIGLEVPGRVHCTLVGGQVVHQN